MIKINNLYSKITSKPRYLIITILIIFVVIAVSALCILMITQPDKEKASPTTPVSETNLSLDQVYKQASDLIKNNDKDGAIKLLKDAKKDFNAESDVANLSELEHLIADLEAQDNTTPIVNVSGAEMYSSN